MSINDIFGLEGQHAVVTGGGSGLGLAIATCFVEAGAKVTIVGTNAAKLASACETLGPSATSHVFDVTDTAGATGFASDVAKNPDASRSSSTMPATRSRSRWAR